MLNRADVKWFCGLIAAVCIALVAQDHLIPEPWNHVVSGLGIAATAISGYLITPVDSVKKDS
jgi:hypothetical protein